LAKVIEELKSLLKLNDEISRNLKLNGLKFCHSICKDDNYMNKFLNAGGIELMQDMLKYEMKNVGDSSDESISIKNQYITNEPYVLKIQDQEDKSKDTKIVDECFKIIGKVIKKKDDSNIEPDLFSNMVHIIE
jgi:hypothetical protein